MKLTKTLVMLCILMLGSITALAQDNAPNFTTLDSVIQTLRNGDDDTLALRVDKNSFVVLQQQTSSVSEAEAKKTIELNPKGEVWLKYGDAGYAICYEIDADTVIEAPESGKSSSGDFRKVVSVPVAKYDLSNWNAFANYLIANGLYSFRDYTYQNSHRYTLSFSPLTPASISVGSEWLPLSVEFSRHLRLSPRHPGKSGSNGFVILFHDPHWDTIGTSESLAGLRALIDSNKDRKFEFLVEGAYEGSRNIGLATLPQVLDLTAPGATRTRMVQSLLHSYLIDTPTAYRLLYGPGIKATAIDDNRSLGYRSPRVLRPLHEQLKSLERLQNAVDSLSLPDPAIKENINAVVNVTQVFLTADFADATDEAYVEYFNTLSRSFKTLADIATLLSSEVSSSVPLEAEAFRSDSLACADEANIYAKALERNRIMAELIVAKSKGFQQSIPIAFIGSFHTQGITKILRDNGVGYVVIEPRPRSSVSRLEQERFNQAIHPDTYNAFLASARLHKLNVIPRATTVQTVYRPKMVTKGASLRSELRAAQNRITAIPDAKLNVNEFLAAAGDSGNLTGARLVFHDGNQPPPPSDFSGAFAYFEPGDGKGGSTGRPAFTVENVRDVGWSSADRYNFLRSVVFPKCSDPGGLQLTREATIYSEVSNEWIFSTVYDPASGRVYCFEERVKDNRRTSFLLPVPIPSGQSFTDIRMQVVEVIKRKEKARG